MKKVLILAYDFPPYSSVGAQRPFSWYKYFYTHGFYPVIITRQWTTNKNRNNAYVSSGSSNEVLIKKENHGEIHYTPYNQNYRDKLAEKNKLSIVRKLLSLLQYLTEYFCFWFDNKKQIFKYANQKLKEENFDLIIATGEPFVLFRYAKKLSKKYSIKWVADFRDAWTTNITRDRDIFQKILNKTLFRQIEKSLLKSVSLITTAAPSYKKQLKKLHKKTKIKTVLNGYLARDIDEELPRYLDTAHLNIVYAGSIYDYQPLEDFASAFLLLYEKKPILRICFLGIENKKSAERIRLAFNGKDCYRIYPSLEQNEFINELKYANYLLLFGSPFEERIPAKIFDYLYVKKPIFLFYDDNGILNKIIKETDSGILIQKKDELSKEIVLNPEKDKRKFTFKNINKYSREYQTEIFCKELNSTLDVT